MSSGYDWYLLSRYHFKCNSPVLLVKSGFSIVEKSFFYSHYYSMMEIPLLLYHSRSSCFKILSVLSLVTQINLMGECKKDVTPLLTHWSYIFLAQTHRIRPACIPKTRHCWPCHCSACTAMSAGCFHGWLSILEKHRVCHKIMLMA